MPSSPATHHEETDRATHAGAAPALPDVLEEHLEEFAFLSIQRRRALFANDVGERGVNGLDSRLAAHQDGLLLAGQDGVEIAASHLESRDPWQRYAAARIWIEHSRPDVDRVFDRMERSDASGLASWREALRHVPTSAIDYLKSAVLDDGCARPVSVLADACGWHDILPPGARERLAGADAAEVRRAVARTIRHSDTRSPSATATLRARLLEDPDPIVARAALWSLARVDSSAAAQRCRDRIDAGLADAFDVQSLGYLGRANDFDRIAPLVADAETRTAAIRALGFLGNVSAVDLLLRLLASSDADVAMAAGEAFETIAGPVPEPPCDCPPSLSKAGPNPTPALWAEEIWRRRAGAMDAGRRWLLGRPFPESSAEKEEPMLRVWLHSVGSLQATPLATLALEVPDAFFDGRSTHEVIPGE